jgi:hypothetical protein
MLEQPMWQERHGPRSRRAEEAAQLQEAGHGRPLLTQIFLETLRQNVWRMQHPEIRWKCPGQAGVKGTSAVQHGLAQMSR